MGWIMDKKLAPEMESDIVSNESKINKIYAHAYNFCFGY